MDQYEMLGNIKTHSIFVAKVAHVIARNLVNRGIDISVELATVGALMHDVGKTASLKSGEDHSKIGRQICIENGLYEIADIVGEHVRMKGYRLNNKFSEKEIVYYSDKRVNHDQIVALEDRMNDIITRYGRDQENLCNAIRANFEICKAVEKKLFSKMNFSVDRLAVHAEAEDI